MSLRDRIATLSDESKSQLLDSLGLEPKKDPLDLIFPALGIFSAGLVVGAMLGLFLAPKSGPELRGDIRSRARDLRERAPKYLNRDTSASASEDSSESA